jgi:hypothetical protein
MKNLTTLSLTRYELTLLARALSISATEAYADERLHAAREEHRFAARCWVAAGSHDLALHASALAEAIDNELIELAAGEEETV